MVKASDLFKFPESLPFREFFISEDPPWLWLEKIKEALSAFSFPELSPFPGNFPKGILISGRVYLHDSVKIAGNCVIEGPAYLGAGTEIRPGAYLRGNVIVGEGCILGHASEYKNCLLLEGVETAHFNYVGDSVLGSRVHLGAGAILANQRLDRGTVRAHTPEGRIATGLRKMGAILGDGVAVGCNAVLQPGTIIGREARVMPTMSFGGYLPPHHVVSREGEKNAPSNL